MAGRVEYSQDAQDDLSQLYDWIATDSGLARADAVLARIERTLELIADVPLIGRIRRDLAGRHGEPRSFSVAPWLIIYRPLADEAGILVFRVVDGRRNVARLIR